MTNQEFIEYHLEGVAQALARVILKSDTQDLPLEEWQQVFNRLKNRASQ